MSPAARKSLMAERPLETENIHVVCRVRPPNSREVKERCREIVSVDESAASVAINCGYGETQQWRFDSVFGPTASQVRPAGKDVHEPPPHPVPLPAVATPPALAVKLFYSLV